MTHHSGEHHIKQPSQLPLLLRYALALLSVVWAAALRYGLDPLLGDRLPYVTFLLAVIVTARYAGYGPAMLSNILGSLAGMYLFTEPRGHISIEHQEPGMVIDFVLFLTIGFVSATLSYLERRAAWQAAAAHDVAYTELVERGRAEQAQRETHRRLIEILESISDAFYAVDREWRFIYVNRKAEALWGRRREELIGRNLWEEFPEFAEGLNYEKAQAAMLQSEPTEWEILSPRLHRWISVSAYPSEAGLSIYFRDIHDRRTAEDRLRESYERISEVLESISDAFYAVNSSWHFTYINRRAEEMWGRSRDDLLGKNLWSEFPQAVGTETHQHLIEAMQDQRAAHFEAVSPIIGRWIEINAYPSDNGLSVYFRDIAERKEAEMQRADVLRREQAARRAAEEANAIKTRFLAMISHELRTPLASIKGFASTLLASDITWDDDSRQEFIEIINTESDKLTELVDHLLDLSRLQAGTLRIDSKPEQVSAILEVARPQLETLAKEHHLEVDLPPDLALVQADKQRAAQVIVNLVSNAAKYTPPGGEIQISARGCENGASCVRFSVRDEGPGIPFEARDKVFEAFRQLNTRASLASDGAGLGLAICKGIVEAHGGDIWIEDTQAPGATISFTLPIAETP